MRYLLLPFGLVVWGALFVMLLTLHILGLADKDPYPSEY